MRDRGCEPPKTEETEDADEETETEDDGIEPTGRTRARKARVPGVRKGDPRELTDPPKH